MSERDELRERIVAVLDDPDLTLLKDWAIEPYADAVLAEIERTHVLVPLPGCECECEDCYPELTAAAGQPVSWGVTTITWDWGELSKDGS